jgi:hypothetical protein
MFTFKTAMVGGMLLFGGSLCVYVANVRADEVDRDGLSRASATDGEPASDELGDGKNRKTNKETSNKKDSNKKVTSNKNKTGTSNKKAANEPANDEAEDTKAGDELVTDEVEDAKDINEPATNEADDAKAGDELVADESEDNEDINNEEINDEVYELMKIVENKAFPIKKRKKAFAKLKELAKRNALAATFVGAESFDDMEETISPHDPELSEEKLELAVSKGSVIAKRKLAFIKLDKAKAFVKQGKQEDVLILRKEAKELLIQAGIDGEDEIALVRIRKLFKNGWIKLDEEQQRKYEKLITRYRQKHGC